MKRLLDAEVRDVMTDKEQFEEYRRELLEYDHETVRFLSNQQKSERERSVCAAFLRCVGVGFSVAELLPGTDPPDVKFRDVCFEVRDILDEGRKPHGEAKAWVERDEQAQTVDDVLLPPWRPRTPCAYAEVFSQVTQGLAQKSSRYGVAGCAQLDALVYVRLQNMTLDLNSLLPSYVALQKQGWRSVSFVLPPYSYVIYATELAPAFLRDLAGHTRQEWNDPGISCFAL